MPPVARHYLNSFFNIAPKPLVSQKNVLDKNVLEFYHGPTEKNDSKIACLEKKVANGRWGTPHHRIFFVADHKWIRFIK